VGPWLGACIVPARISNALHLEEGAEVLEVRLPPPAYRWGNRLQTPADTQTAHAFMRYSLAPAKMQYAFRTLLMLYTAAFALYVAATHRATLDAVVGTPTSDAAWVQTTLPLGEGGCGVASAADVAPVAPMAEVLQSLAQAEPMLGGDRQLVFPLATEVGLLDALNARLPPPLEPLANWKRTGKVKQPEGEVRSQHWWSARLTPLKAAALLEAATGQDVASLEA